MSDKAKAVVWDYYEPTVWGVPLITVSAMADGSDDYGRGISAPLPELARKTRQSVRTVQRHVRALEVSGLLECVERVAGGAHRANTYRLRLDLMVAQKTGKNPDKMSGLTLTKCHGFLTENPDNLSGFSDVPISSTTYIKNNVEDVVRRPPVEDAKDRDLAAWIFEKIRALNPKHREPSWAAWLRDIRLLRERDKLTHREIAQVFAWANGDAFWQRNVLCPGTLRKHWDRLNLAMKASPAAAPAAVDTTCCGVKDDGARCGATNTTSDSTDGRGPFYCWTCRRAMERARAGQGAAMAGGVNQEREGLTDAR